MESIRRSVSSSAPQIGQKGFEFFKWCNPFRGKESQERILVLGLLGVAGTLVRDWWLQQAVSESVIFENNLLPCPNKIQGSEIKSEENPIESDFKAVHEG